MSSFLLFTNNKYTLPGTCCSELYAEWEGKLDMTLFRAAYPRYPDISQIHVSTEEREYTMDLRPVMNRTPCTVLHSTPLPQVGRSQGVRIERNTAK